MARELNLIKLYYKITERAIKISEVLKEWFKQTNKSETTPEEIIPYLYEKGIYNKGKRNDALQLRKDLRKLVDENKLNLIEEARFVQINEIKEWSFVKVN